MSARLRTTGSTAASALADGSTAWTPDNAPPAMAAFSSFDEPVRLTAKRARGRREVPDAVLALLERSEGEPAGQGFLAPYAEALGDSPGPVCLHTDEPAAQAAQLLGAEAFTVGSDVYFARGRLRPGTEQGDHLLLHELAHVLAPSGPVASNEASLPADPIEREAGARADAALAVLLAAEPAFDAHGTPRPASVGVHREAEIGLEPGLVEDRLRLLARHELGVGPEQLEVVVRGILDDLGDQLGGLDLLASDAELLDQLGALSGVDPLRTSPDPPELEPEPIEAQAAVPAEVEAPEAGLVPVEEAGAEEAAPLVEEAPVEAPTEVPAPPQQVELLMPPPPEGLSEADTSRIAGVSAQAGTAAQTSSVMPAAAPTVGSARGAVTEPVAETEARSDSAVTAILEERPPPSPEIEALCERMLEAIREQRPADEDELVNADPAAAVEAVSDAHLEEVQQGAEDVAGGYDAMGAPPEGSPATTPTPMTPTAESVDPGEIAVEQAVPDAVPDEDVSLDADVEANEQRITDAGMDTEVAQLSAEGDPEGPIASANEGAADLAETAARDPAEVLAEQAAARTQAEGDMVALRAQALTAMAQSRAQTVQGVGGQQTGMVQQEQATRESVALEMQGIFDTAKTAVDALIEPLQRNARARWDAGIAEITTTFENDLSAVERWIEDRHSGVGGFFLSIGDAIGGLPDEIIEAYNTAELNFGTGATDLLRDISRDVNQVIVSCQTIIAEARRQIDQRVASLPEELRTWAEGQAQQVQGQLDGLGQQVEAARTSVNTGLMDAATHAVHEARSRIETLREAAKGLIGQIAAAIAAFIDDPVRFIINGLLTLVGIEPPRFWTLVDRIGEVIDRIADDPLGFAENLLSAVGAGFQRFFDNFPGHLLEGLLTWLFSGLGEVGVHVPPDLSLRSIIVFFLEVMGISWERIRRLLAKHIGEENVALIEQAWSVVSTLIEQGPAGLFEMLKAQLNPETILQMVLEAAVSYVAEVIATQVTARIVMLFNPVGAIAQAIEAIYKVLKWLFENAARIFTLVETIVNGALDILNGNIDGMAGAVERALVGLLPVVIDFIAGFVGLGDLPEKVADIIRGLQETVEGILDRVIGWLADQGRALLSALGLGAQDGAEAEGEGNLGEHEHIVAGGEAHELWVDVDGESATVMFASTPEPLTARLARLEAEANGDGETLLGIAEAQDLLSQVDALATGAVAGESSEAGAPDVTGREASEVAAKREALTRKVTEIIDRLNGPAARIRRMLNQKVVEVGFPQRWVGPELPDGYHWRSRDDRIYVQRSSGRADGAEALPQVHVNNLGLLVEGPRTPGPMPIEPARARAVLANHSPEGDWVAKFATAGRKLEFARPEGREVTFGAIWASIAHGKVQAVSVASRAFLQTIAATAASPDAPPEYAALSPRERAVRARSLAIAMIDAMENVPLYYVKATDIPRYVQESDFVVIRDGRQDDVRDALYRKIAEAEESPASLQTMVGQIHHVVPLYLGGGHDVSNLARVFGNAAESDTAHHMMHALIDETAVRLDVLRAETRLGHADLANAITANLLGIVLGALYQDGRITYQEHTEEDSGAEQG